MFKAIFKKKAKAGKIIILVLALAVFVGGCVKTSDVKEVSKEPIKIGAILALTGKIAPWGETAFNGIELALEEINKDGGINGQKLEVVYEDSQSDVTKAVSAYKKLVNIDKVSAVIGMTSSQIRAISPLLKKDEIPTIALTTGLTDITKDNDYLFRIWPTGKDKALSMKPALEQYRDKKIAVISANNESPLDLFFQLNEHVLSELGIEVIYEDVVEKNEKDMRTNLIKIKSSEADLFFVNLYMQQIGLCAKQARVLGIDIPMFSSELANSIKEIELAGGGMEGMWFPGDPAPANDFLKNYREKYNIESTRVAPNAYDALITLSKAIKESDNSKKDIKNKLHSVDYKDGALGRIKFNSNGDVVLVPILKQVKNGQIVPLENY